MPFDDYQNKKEIFLKKITLKSEEIVAVETIVCEVQLDSKIMICCNNIEYRLTKFNVGKV